MTTPPLLTNVKAADPRNPSVAKRVSLWLLLAGQVGEDKWTEFGTVIDGQLNPAIAYLEHYSNRRGAKTRDRIDISEIKADFQFKLDEVNAPNLQKIFGGSGSRSTGSAVIRDGIILGNPGGGGAIALPMSGLDSVIVRSTNEEGSVTSYDGDALATDTGDTAAGGDFNNTTDPIVIVAASYPGTPTVVGSFIKVGSEILKVTAFGGGNITLSRGALGTTPAAHVNGTQIFKDAGTGDYVSSLATGQIGILPAGDLSDGTAVEEVHVHMAKTVNTEKFQIFDGSTIKGKAQLQILTPGGLRMVATFNSVVITNQGAITIGDGSKWIECGVKMECLADSTGSLGDVHVLDAAATV